MSRSGTRPCWLAVSILSVLLSHEPPHRRHAPPTLLRWPAGEPHAACGVEKTPLCAATRAPSRGFVPDLSQIINHRAIADGGVGSGAGPLAFGATNGGSALT